MPVDRLAPGLVAVVVLVASCSSAGPANPDDALLLADLDIGGVQHDFGLFPNQQGPDAPCVGVSLSADDSSTTTMACPTEVSESPEYAAVLELDTGSFIVGYGLAPGESITARTANGVALADGPDGETFFVIRLRESPGPDAVDLLITTATGGVRTLSAHGWG
ncbi:MAG: hypothetical protein AAF962_14635 [Actinomycetota bacterium]